MFSKTFFSAAIVTASVAGMNAQTVSPAALPTGGSITAGQGTIAQTGAQLQVMQASQRLITEWSTFNIGRDAAVHFLQPSREAVALNRIADQNPSQVLGSLNANGRVFLINPNGLYFGPQASVDVGSLVASTLALSDADFLAGNYAFGGAGKGMIANAGVLTADEGGVLAFISPRIENQGTLAAPGGSVGLAAGDRVTLDFNGDGLINLAVDSAAVDAHVVNKGLIKTDGGLAVMTARAAGELVRSVVNNEGIVEANTLVERGGRILLDGGDAGTVENRGKLLARGDGASELGGDIVVTGEKVGVFGAGAIDASGNAGGGGISIGGGFQGNDPAIRNASRTFVGTDAVVRADATGRGSGGEVVIWSDELTRVGGTVSARGGEFGGDGGDVEISSRGFLEMTGRADAGAARGAGGRVLFDPKDLIVQAGGGAALTDVDAFADNASGTSTIDPATITAATNAGTAVTLQANNDITVNSSIFTSNGGGTGGALFFDAGRSITLNASIYSDDADVNFTLNHASADGGNRDAGPAAFLNNSFIDAGSGAIAITLDSGSTSGGIATGQITANNLTITHNGPTAGAVTGRIDLGGTEVTNNLVVSANADRDVVNTAGTVTVRGTSTFDVAAGDVTLTRATTDLSTAAFTHAGDVLINDTNALRLGASNITGTLGVTTRGPISSSGALTVSGTTTLTANNGGFGYADPYINLSTANDFQGDVSLSVPSLGDTGTGGYATINDTNSINFSGVTVGNNFTVTANGAVTDSGTVMVPNFTSITAGAANDVTLDSAANNFNFIRVATADDVVLNDTNALQFGYYSSGPNTISGDLSVTAGGDISQFGYNTYAAPYDSRLLVTGDSVFTVTAANSNLFLGYVNPLDTSYGLANNFAGTVTIAKSGAGSYQDVYLRNVSTSTAQIIGLATVGTLRDVALRYDNAAGVELPGMTLSRDLSLSAPSGSITQAGALIVPGKTMLRASNAADVTLTDAANNFYRIDVNGARDVSLVDTDAIELYSYWNYPFSLSRNLSVTAGGAITDASDQDQYFPLNVNSGTATFNAGASNLTLDNPFNGFNRVDIVAANNAVVSDLNDLIFGDVTVGGSLTANSIHWTGSSALTQAGGTAIAAGATTFNGFQTGITLGEAANVFGAIALSANTGPVALRENDAITQASAWTLNPAVATVSLTTSDDQAIMIDNASNVLGNLVITQVASGNSSPGAVSIRETDANGITQGAAWTTHGATTLNSGAGNSIALTNPNNVLGPLQLLGATAADRSVTIFAKDGDGHAAIFDAGANGVWDTGYTRLVAYDATGASAGAGDIEVTQAGNAMGDLFLRGDAVSIREDSAITDSATEAWITTGTTTLNAGANAIALDNVTNVLGALAVAGTPSSVLITDNSDLTQASAWTLGAAPVTVDARNHHIDLSASGNVWGGVDVVTSNGVPLSLTVTEDDAITQGGVWALNGVPITLTAENDKTITLTNASNILGNLIATGGIVSITENDVITQGGPWTTTGATTLNAGANAITLGNAANELGDLAIAGSPAALTIAENGDITQDSAWSLAATPVALTSHTGDIFLTRTANQLGDLTLAAQNVSVTEDHLISDGSAWTVPGTTTLAAGANAIVLNANPESDFGTLKIDSAASADIADANSVILDTSQVAGTFTLEAGGAVTQTGPITANALHLAGDGSASLTHVANNVTNLAAGFSGGDFSYTDADDVNVAVIGGTTGINIGANDVTLRSVSGTITGLTSVNANSSSLSVDTGAALTLPQLTIGGAQTYTATGGITLTAPITSTAGGAIVFNSPLTLATDLSIQSSNSPITFNGTIDGAMSQLIVNAGSGAVDFTQAVTALGNSASANSALQLTSGAAVFHSTLAANNGLSVTGPVTFSDTVTLADGNAASVFAGLVTLGKPGGMELSGYDGLTFNGGVLLQGGAATIDSNNSPLIFQGANTVGGPYSLTLDAGSQQITGLDHLGSDLTGLTVTAASPTIPVGGLSIAGPQTYNAAAGTSLFLNGDVTSTDTGAITFNGSVLLGTDSTVTAVDSPVTFSGALDGSHDLTVNSGTGASIFSGKVGNVAPLGDGTGAALTLAGAGAASFADTLVANSGLSIAGPVTFTHDVTLNDGSVGSTFGGAVTAGGLTLSGFDGLTFSSAVTLSGPLTLDAEGGPLSFGGPVTGAHALTLTLGGGSVAGLGQLDTGLAGLTLNNTSTVTLPALMISGPQIYNGPVSIAGNLMGTALTFNAATQIAANGLTFAAGTGTIRFVDTLSAGANDLVLQGDEIDFAAPVSGTGGLVLRPDSLGKNIVVGGAAPTVDFDVTGADVAWLPATLSGLVIGRSDGTGTLAIAGATNVGATPLTLHGGSGISQGAALTAGPLTVRAAGGAITLNDTANSLGAISVIGTPTAVGITDSTDITQGADWTLGAASVDLDAGEHDIFLTQAGNSFGTISFAGRDVQIVENAATDIGTSSAENVTVTSADALHLSGALTAAGDVAFTAAGPMTQGAPLSIGGGLSLTTTHAAGDVSLNNSGAAATVLGDNRVGGDYVLTATGDTVSQTPSGYVQVAGDLTVNSSVATLDGAANLVRGTTNLPGVNSLLRQSGVITLGDLNESGNYTVISEAASRAFSGATIHGTAIDLSDPANAVSGAISVQTQAPAVVTGADVQTGIVQTPGTSITVGGIASFTAENSTAGTLGIDLSNAGNSFGTLKLSGSLINVRNDAPGLTTLDSVNASTRFLLAAAGPVSQNGAIVAPELAVTAGGAVTLNHPANNAGVVAIDAQGGVSFVDTDAFSIGTVAALSGIDTHGHALTLTAGGAGAITQSDAVKNVTSLSANAGGAVTLDHAANTFTEIGAIASGGAVNVFNSGGSLLVSGPVQSAAGDVVVRTAGDLTLGSGASVNAAAGDIALSTEGAGNFINQAGASALSVGSANRWLVYSRTPDLVETVHTEKGGLTSDFRLHGKTFGSDTPASIANTGDGFIYADPLTATLTITPVIAGSATHVYGDTPTGALGYAASAGFVDSEDNLGNIGLAGTPVFSGSLSSTLDAGAYSFFYTGGLSADYTLVADTSGASYTVTPAPLTYVANAASRVYGDANPSLGGTIAGFKLGQDVSVLGGAANWSTTADGASHVGAYPVTGSGYSSDNYSFTQAPGNATALTITPRPLSITADTQQRIYGEANPVNGAFSIGGDGLVNGDTLGSSVGVSSPATVASDVGTYALTPAGATFVSGQASDYAISYLDGTLQITPRGITVTANDQSRAYGDANPTAGAITVGGLGLANGDALNGTTSVSSNATVLSDVGSYSLTPSGATFASGNAGNYAITYADGTLAVTPRAITITADNQSRYYGNANPADGAFTVGGTGLVNGNTLANTVSVSSPASTGSNVGTYSLTPAGAVFTSGSANNYAITYADGALAVTPRPLTLTPDTQDRVYGDANPVTGTFAIGGLGLVNGDTLNPSLALSSPATATSHVGAYALNGGGAAFTSGSSGNYAITYAPGVLNVTPASLVYTADPATRIYGDANPALSGTVTGFRNGDTLESATSGSLFFTTNAGVASNVGAYSVEGGGLTAGDYTFVQAPGNATALSITARPLVVSAVDQTRVYGDANPATIPVTADNLVNGDTIGSASITSAATIGSGVGNYALTPASANFATGLASNYAITYTPGTLAITPRPLMVTPADQTRYYGDANPLFGAVVADNLANGDTLGASTLSSIATVQSDVGSYALMSGPAAFTQGSAGNYTISYAPGTLAVTPRPISLTVADQTRTYGAANPTTSGFMLAGSGLVNGDTLASTVAVTSSATATSNVGSYELTASSADFTSGSAGNYAITFNDGVLAITPATLTYNAAPVSIAFGDPLPALTGTVTGFVNGETLESATTGSLNWTTPASQNLALGVYAINGSGLTAVDGNYHFVQAPDNATALTIGTAQMPENPRPTLPTLPPIVPAVVSADLGLLTPANQAYAVTQVRAEPVFAGIEFVREGVTWPELDRYELFGLSNLVDPAPFAGESPAPLQNPARVPPLEIASIERTGDALTLKTASSMSPAAPAGPQASGNLAVYLEENDTTSLVGAFDLTEGGTELSLSPGIGQPVPPPGTVDSADARRAAAAVSFEGRTVKIRLTLLPGGLLVAELPAAFVDAEGERGAALAAVAAARREFAVPAKSLKAVKLVPQEDEM